MSVAAAWVYLIAAIASEVVGTLSLKASEGFSKLLPSIGVVIGYAMAFVLMAQAMKELQVGVTYATWSGLGIIGATVGSYFLFGESLTRMTIIGMAIVIFGIAVMSFGGASH